MHAVELPGLAATITEGRQLLQGLAVNDVDLLVGAVGHEDELLFTVFRERDVPHGALTFGVLREVRLLHELAFGGEHLQPVAQPVAHVHQAIHRELGAVHGVAELQRGWRGRIIRRQRGVVGFGAVGAPPALDLAGVGVEHRDALVQVPVGHIRLVCQRIDGELRGPAEILGVIAVAGVGVRRVGRSSRCRTSSATRALLPELHEEFAVLRELENVGIGRAVAAQPHVAFVVDVDAVEGVVPFVPLAGTAPVPQQVAGLIELEDRRRTGTAVPIPHLEGLLVIGQRGRAMHDPDVIVGVDPDADGRPEQPVVRQGLGPVRINLESRCLDPLRGQAALE